MDRPGFLLTGRGDPLEGLALHMQQAIDEGLGLGLAGGVGARWQAQRAPQSLLKLDVAVLKLRDEAGHEPANLLSTSV